MSSRMMVRPGAAVALEAGGLEFDGRGVGDGGLDDLVAEGADGRRRGSQCSARMEAGSFFEDGSRPMQVGALNAADGVERRSEKCMGGSGEWAVGEQVNR